jgi:hypothetical protein
VARFVPPIQVRVVRRLRTLGRAARVLEPELEGALEDDEPVPLPGTTPEAPPVGTSTAGVETGGVFSSAGGVGAGAGSGAVGSGRTTGGTFTGGTSGTGTGNVAAAALAAATSAVTPTDQTAPRLT